MYRTQIRVLSMAVWTAVLAGPTVAAAEPSIVRFWLVDAATDTRLKPLDDYASLPLPLLPDSLSIEAEANADTESVIMRIEHVQSSLENVTPYSLVGDDAGDFYEAEVLRQPGWVHISAQPFGGDNASGVAGEEVGLSLYMYQPDFFVTSASDQGDGDPGDGRCSTLPRLTTWRTALSPTLPRRPVVLDPIRTGQEQLSDRFIAVWDPRLLRGPCTLRAAIEESNALAGTQSVLVDGTKGPFVLSKGQLVITDGMTLRGHERPVIDANNASRVVRVDGKGEDIFVSMTNFDFRRGSPGTTERGGAIAIDNEASVYIADSVVRESRANFGGGLYLQAGGSLTMTRSAVHDNIAGHPESFGGGGVTQRGGGIFNLEGVVSITDSSIFANKAVRGGGLSNFGGTVRLENSSVIDNEAASIGGGIENRHANDEKGVLHMSFVTVANNAAGTSGAAPEELRGGGGLYNRGWADMANSILAANSDYWFANDAHHAPDCDSPTLYDFKSFRRNVVGVLNDNCSFTDYSSGTDVFFEHGTASEPLDPGLLGPWLWDHLLYYILSPGSVALDAAASASASLYPCFDHDMRGRTRPVGEGCDIGAVERQ